MLRPADNLPSECDEFPEEEFENIRSVMLVRTGFDLAVYKDRYIKRRIGMRIRANSCLGPSDYGRLLSTDQGEAERLLDTATVNVSRFFRNVETFDKLREVVLPRLLERSDRENRPIDVWSAGCACGEEPYTFAIMIRELRQPPKHPPLITATDIDERALRLAAEGVYEPERIVDVSREILARYFDSEQRRYRIKPEVRKMVGFRRGDLLDPRNDAPRDLILCRNVLMYLERRHQREVVERFASCLRPGGILVLGRAEALLGDMRRFFACDHPAEHIYRKI